MGCFQEFEPAKFDERDVPPAELDFENSAVVARAKQDGLLFQRHALFPVGEYALDHEVGLGRIVLNCHKGWLFGRASIGPKVLGEPFLGERDHRVGGCEDRHGGAVIAIERDNRGGWIELFRKIENVADGGRAKAVDRLGIIANNREPLAIRLERQQDRRLDGIGVLILIHQHMVEQAANFARDFGHLHQFRPIEKKIVIVEDMLALLRLDIALEQAAKILFEAGAPGEMLCAKLPP